MTALLIALLASHGYMVVRVIVRHVVERVFWKGSEEVKKREKADRVVKETFLGEFVRAEEVVEAAVSDTSSAGDEVLVEPPIDGGLLGFWDHDEGLDEISRVSKEV